MHANVALFRRMVEVWAPMLPLMPMITGTRQRSGTRRGPVSDGLRGRDGIISFWAEQDRLTGGGFRPEFLGLAADDHRVYLLVRFEAADASISFHRAAVYDVEDGAFASARFFEDDPEAAVAFFSLAGGGS